MGKWREAPEGQVAPEGWSSAGPEGQLLPEGRRGPQGLVLPIHGEVARRAGGAAPPLSSPFMGRWPEGPEGLGGVGGAAGGAAPEGPGPILLAGTPRTTARTRKGSRAACGC